jgi:hypothetical protein
VARGQSEGKSMRSYALLILPSANRVYASAAAGLA